MLTYIPGAWRTYLEAQTPQNFLYLFLASLPKQLGILFQVKVSSAALHIEGHKKFAFSAEEIRDPREKYF